MVNRYSVGVNGDFPVFHIDSNGRWVKFEDVENILKIHLAIDFFKRKGVYCDEWSSAGMWTATCKIMETPTEDLTDEYIMDLMKKAEDA